MIGGWAMGKWLPGAPEVPGATRRERARNRWLRFVLDVQAEHRAQREAVAAALRRRGKRS